MQAVVSLASVSAKNFRVNALSIIPNTDPELLFVIPDLHFYVSRLRVPEGIAQRLADNPVDLVTKDRMQFLRRAGHRDLKHGGTVVGLIGRQFFSEGPQGNGKVADFECG